MLIYSSISQENKLPVRCSERQWRFPTNKKQNTAVTVLLQKDIQLDLLK